jgi:hypothetical protein
MQRYIGLDVHAASGTAVVIDARGKRVGAPHVLETNGQALIEFFKCQPGAVHVCLEEGTQRAWLVEILRPHVARIVVAHVAESRGPKDDVRDASTLAERLRTNAIDTTVFKDTGTFSTSRHVAKAHAAEVQDTVRVQCRLRALFRSRGIPTSKPMDAPRHRAAWLAKLPPSSRGAAALLDAQYDTRAEVRAHAFKDLVAESHRHPMAAVLERVPGLGGVRVAQRLSIVAAPDRFRTRQPFWSYGGLGIVMRSSSDFVRTPTGGWTRAVLNKTRGLHLNHHHTRKAVFQGAATSILTQHRDDPRFADYERMVQSGSTPTLAKVTLARKLAALTLAMWKRKEVYDPARCRTPQS